MKNKTSIKIKLDYGDIEYKECKCCHRLLPISKFNINKKDYTYRKIYYDSRCKSCKSEYIRKMRQARNESTDYITLKAEKAYNSMKQRCMGKNRRQCYYGATICEEWLNDKQSFIRWYKEHYYEIDGLFMTLDKDLFSGDSKYYSPDTVCILPQVLNTMLSNSKRHRLPEWKTDSKLPLGVYYDRFRNKYYAKIKYSGAEKQTKLSYHDTVDEAFEDYRIHKKRDIKRMADKYKEYLPEYIYDALLQFEIKPY